MNHRITLLLPLAAAGLFLVAVPITAAQEESTVGLIAIDANPEGNTATELGTLNGCARVEIGNEIQIDAVIDAIPEDRRMIGFETRITYDPSLLEVVANNYDDFLLSAADRYQPFAHPELNDTVPDTDGVFRTAIIDLASNDVPDMTPAPTPGSNTEAGPGVLNRVTFKAKAEGVSIVEVQFKPEEQVYPLIIDLENKETSIEERGSAAIAVGQDCPGDRAEPVITDLPSLEELYPSSPTPEGQTPVPGLTPDEGLDTDNDSDTIGIALVAVLGGLGVAGVGSGGWLLYQRSQRNKS